MKFFDIIPLSSFRSECSAYPYDVLDTLLPFHRLYSLYSMLRNQLPRNAFPNIFFPFPGILSAALLMFSPSIALLSCLRLAMVDIRYACVHGLYLQPLLESSHSHYYRFAPANRDIVPEHRPLTHDNDTWLPIQGEHLANLQYENSSEIRPYRKIRTFIESKVAAINCGDLTHY